MRKLLPLALVATLALPGTALAARHRDGSTPAGKALTAAVTKIKTRTFNTVGAGDAGLGLDPILVRVKHRTAAKKPLIFLAGQGWCPHCAAISWPLTIALSRFGDFEHLGRIDSGTAYRPPDPSTAFHHTKGISYYDATYASRYVRFSDAILASKTGRRLGRLTRRERALLKPFDPKLATPGLSLGGLYGEVGSHFPLVYLLAGKSWADVATALKHPRSQLAKVIIGQANVYTAGICKATHDKPRSVCRSAGVRAGAKLLPKR